MTARNNPISTKLQEVLAEGTPKQKALLVCKNYYEPQTLELYGGKPTLTAAEAKGIERSLLDDKERAAYYKWIRIYNTYTSMLQTVGLAAAEYDRTARTLVGYISVWDAYERETDLINSLYLSIKETGSKEAIATFERIAYEERRSIKWGALVKEKDGYYRIDSSLLYNSYIKDAQKNVIESYSALKALIIVLEKFMKNTSSKSFVPDLLKDSIEDSKKDYLVYGISSRYSCRELRKRKENGEKITENEEKRALFPDYETLPVNPVHVEHFEIILKSHYKG